MQLMIDSGLHCTLQLKMAMRRHGHGLVGLFVMYKSAYGAKGRRFESQRCHSFLFKGNAK